MTKTIDDINVETWFIARELSVAPEHFTKVNTPASPEAATWILEKLRGRFAMVSAGSTIFGLCPAFEDPKEAVFYELTWG